MLRFHRIPYPDSKVHGGYMGFIWGRQELGGPHVGPMILVVWVIFLWQAIPCQRPTHSERKLAESTMLEFWKLQDTVFIGSYGYLLLLDGVITSSMQVGALPWSPVSITVTSQWARWRLISRASTVYSGGDQIKHQSSTLLAFVRGIHRLPVKKGQ